MRFRLTRPFLFHQQLTEAVMSHVLIWIEPQRGFQFIQSTLRISDPYEDHSQVRVGERIARLKSDGSLEMDLRVRKVALLIEKDPKVVVHFSISRIQRKGTLKMILGGGGFV